MASVTQRIKTITQPQGGYLPVAMFDHIVMNNKVNDIAYEESFIHGSIIGTAVDYLTRFMLTGDVGRAFSISLIGAEYARQSENAKKLLDQIQGMDDKSIQAACHLVQYDVFARNAIDAIAYLHDGTIAADMGTISNIRIMVESALRLFEKHGTIVSIGTTFEGGYTDTINSGDADYLTVDTLWDFKVTKRERPTSQETLQLLVYYIMGLHSLKHTDFERVKYLGIFNPRYNTIYRCAIDKIDKETIRAVEERVIRYGSDWKMLEYEERREIYQKLKRGEALTTAEVCFFLQIERKTIDFLRRTKMIEGTKKGRAYLYDAISVLEWCDEEKKHYNNISEWLDEGAKRFGRDMTNWKFQCPQCKRIYSVGEYPDICGERSKLLRAAKKCIDWYRNIELWDEHRCTYHYFNVTENVELAKGGIVVEHNSKQCHFFDYADTELGEK
jgi:hypothetical protein